MVDVYLLITYKGNGLVTRRIESYESENDLKEAVEYISKYPNIEKVEVLPLEDNYSPCDGCEPNYINACSSCRFASPDINESLRYSDEG